MLKKWYVGLALIILIASAVVLLLKIGPFAGSAQQTVEQNIPVTENKTDEKKALLHWKRCVLDLRKQRSTQMKNFAD